MPLTASGSPRQLLVRWANQQDDWIRRLTGEILTVRREPPDSSITAVRDLYLAEKQLSSTPAETVPTLIEDGEVDLRAAAVRLVSLRDCRGVNALAEAQSLEFNKRMTVIFGMNATGKTGYVRVLKRVGAVRSAERIIDDIHRHTLSIPPTAVIRYAIGGEEHELAWHDELGVAPLTTMSVFDARAVPLHLEDSVTYVYTPADLAVFKWLHAAIERVRDLLEADAAARQPRQNPFTTAFARGTAIYPMVETLGASTNLRELEEFAVFGDDERTELDTRQLDLEMLLTGTVEGNVEVLRNRIAVLHALGSVCTAIDRFDSAAAASAAAAERLARRRHAEAATHAFVGPLADAARPAWQTFLEAGEQFLHAAGKGSYPGEGDTCIFCKQPLDVSATALLRTYRDLASGASAQALDDASRTLTRTRAAVTSRGFADATGSLRVSLPALTSESAPSWVDEGRVVLDLAERLRDSQDPEGPDLVAAQSTARALQPRLTAALGEADETLRAVEGDARAREARIAEERARIAMLEARLRLSQGLSEIQAYVNDAAWSDRLRTLLRGFPSLLKHLTELTKSASDDMMNRDFERAFHEECERLRAPTVVLDFPGRRGQAARRKSVASDHTLDEILSEGEQKVLALADFLAELSLRGGSAPVVFDDPVSSFDAERVSEIAARMVELSEAHQVVVFSHDMWLTSELLAGFDQHPAECSYYQLRADGGRKGVVTRASHPRQDTEASARRQVNRAIQDARGGTDEKRQERIDLAYSHMRTWCETVAENELLGKVVRRYQPNVAMQNLQMIHADRLHAAIKAIYPIWEKACRYMAGHSQPLVTLGVRPTIDELQKDWTNLQAAYTAYSSND